MSSMGSPSKQQVRAELRRRRRELAAQRDRASDDAALAVCAVALADAAGLSAGDVATAYVAFDHEPPTAGLLAALASRGLTVLVPITLPDFDLDWARADDPALTPLGVHAIAQARLLLIPGLAVDHTGTRLGQGGGCYDRALPRRRPGVPVTVLLHPGECAATALPADPHDVRVDRVLTADGVHDLPAVRR